MNSSGWYSRIKDLLGSSVAQQGLRVCGWVRSVRRGKDVAFIALNDGSCQGSLQIVVAASLLQAPALSALGTGACIAVSGDLTASPAAGQSWELQADQLELLGGVDAAYPLQKKRHSFEYLRSILPYAQCPVICRPSVFS